MGTKIAKKVAAAGADGCGKPPENGRRGGREDENARRMPFCLWVLGLYRSWGEGCHQTGWAQVLNQLMCDKPVRRRIERYL